MIHRLSARGQIATVTVARELSPTVERRQGTAEALEAQRALGSCATPSGTMAFDLSAHLVSVRSHRRRSSDG